MSIKNISYGVFALSCFAVLIACVLLRIGMPIDKKTMLCFAYRFWL
jgi:hypothetical protein